MTLAEAKAHLRVDDTNSDTEITSMIKAAREWVETYLDRSLVYRQLTMTTKTFPSRFELPRPPIAAAGTATAVTVTYTLNETGTTAALSATQYRVDRNSTPGQITTTYSGTWPSHLVDENAVTVTWWAGYGPAASDVPAAIRHAVLLLVGFWFENRSTVLVGSISKQLEFAVESLLSSQKWGSYR